MAVSLSETGEQFLFPKVQYTLLYPLGQIIAPQGSYLE